MKNLLWAAAVILIAVPVRADDKKEAKFDIAKLMGKWQYVSGIKNGEKVEPENFKDQLVIFEKDKLTLEGPMKFIMSYELDTTKTPVGIKLKILESPFGAGATAAGIIEINGDELKFCYSPMGEAPSKFEAKDDSMAHLFVLKRAK